MCRCTSVPSRMRPIHCVSSRRISRAVSARSGSRSSMRAASACCGRWVWMTPTAARLVESVLRYIGSEYDFAHAWLLARSLLLRRWWARLRSVPTTMGRSATRFICSGLIAQAFALIGHSILPAGGTVSDREAYDKFLVPADFERASVFAIVWPVMCAMSRPSLEADFPEYPRNADV